uniref:ATP synthase complex subunit 8 n=1 Tax=Callispa bowringii TaxID=2558238 RepID=A0A482JP51_9CUCU|nr:ATP synthase F0 subunit 8 [Callispa bowringii]QBP33860.1 ATP synthase F0 subunit 8 [Callispa bowringii]
MPQMAPLNWLFLMLASALTLLMFSSMIYYSYKFKLSKTLPKMNYHINWKW